MAMSAALGLTAAESVGLSRCRNLSVKSNNTDYLKLLERTGLPSIEEMAMLDACSATKQVQKIRPEWYVLGTKRQIEKAKKSNEIHISRVTKICEGTLIEEILKMRNDYFEKFGKARKQIKDKKKEAVTHYKRLIKKAQRTREGGKRISELNRKRNEEVAILDSPVLSRYFLARETLFDMNDKNKIDYAHLIRTFTLSCRDEFKCLDTVDRVTRFTTPVRKSRDLPRKHTTTINHTKRQKLVITALQCDFWRGNKAFCNYCEAELDLKKPSRKHYSHLLFECTQLMSAQQYLVMDLYPNL